MMKEKARLTKVKGTVLFTVVSVMMVLIVFLMGTLALAATANNRANRNYQKEQTEATARAVLDAVVEAINQDDKKVGGLADKIGGMAMGENLSFNVTFDDGGKYDVTVTKMEQRPFYEKDEWKTGNVYSISTTITMQSTGVETVYTAYMSDAEVNTGGGGGNGGGGGGAFVSMGDAGYIGNGEGYVTGGVSVGLNDDGNQTYTIEHASTQSVPFYVNGNLKSNSEQHIEFNKVAKNQYIAVEGDWTPNTINITTNGLSYPSGALDYTKIPFIYVGGHFDVSASDFKTSDFFSGDTAEGAFNIYCGYMTKATSAKMSYAGDLYCFEPGKTSKIEYNTNTTLLYKWSKSNIKWADSTDTRTLGNLYSKGDVELRNYSVSGDIRVEGNVTIGGGNGAVIEANEVVCGGTLKVESGTTLKCNKIYAKNIVNEGKILCDNINTCNDVTGNAPLTQTVSNSKWYYDLKWKFESPSEFKGENEEYTIKVSLDEVYKVYKDGEESTASWLRKPILVEQQFTGVKLTNADDINSIYNQVRNAVDLSTIRSTDSNKIQNCNSPTKCDEKIGQEQEATVNVDTSKTEAKDLYGKEIYPNGFDKESIRKNLVDPPKPANYTFPDSLEDLNATLTILDADDELSLPKISEVDSSASSEIVMTDSFVWDQTVDKPVRIKPSGNSLAVIVTGDININKDVIIEDREGSIIKPVYFFVRLGGSINISHANLITKAYQDTLKNGANVTIHQDCKETDWYYPNVYIYSEEITNSTPEGDYPKIDQGPNSVITAHVRAASLEFDKGTTDPGAISANITYVQYNDDGTESKLAINGQKTSVYGQLICRKIKVECSWSMVFVTLPKEKECTCTHCDGKNVATHDCSSECDDSCGCICDKCAHKTGSIHGGSSSAAPDKLYTMYYNYY